MSVTLLKDYKSWLTGAVVTFPDSTESALIAQGIAVAAGTTSEPQRISGLAQFATQGGNVAIVDAAGFGTPTYNQGPRYLPVIPLGSAALTGYETNGVAQTAGAINLVEIFVPYIQTWTGAGFLNGTTVGTDKAIVALFGTDGTRLAYSALAGTTTAGASAMQNVAFTSTITLLPGRYFLGLQMNGATDTIRHLLAANGANVCGSTTAGTFGTIPSTMTVPSTFTTAVAPIMQLYA